MHSYREIAADDPRAARRAEGAAFDHVLLALERAWAGQGDRGLALDGVERLWRALMGDLAHPHNALPDALRANLISIGLWMFREVARLSASDGADWKGLIAVNASIRDGLR